MKKQMFQLFVSFLLYSTVIIGGLISFFQAVLEGLWIQIGVCSIIYLIAVLIAYKVIIDAQRNN